MTERPRLARLSSEAFGWIRSDLPRATRIGAISFAISWTFNFVVMTSRGASFADVMASTTSGNIGGGIVYWAVLSLTASAVVAYGVEVGRDELWAAFRALPAAVARMFREVGPLAWSLVAWGASVSLAISGLLSPTVSAAFGLGLIGFAPTALMGIAGRVLIALWAGLSGFFLPQAKPSGSGLGAQLVAVVGSAAGFIVASRASEVAVRLIAAVVLAVAANLLLANRPSRTASLLWVALMGAAFWTAMDGVAAALGGCCGEGHHGIKEGSEAMRFALIGGAAGAGGAVLGAGLGAALASAPPPDLSNLTWNDPHVPTEPPPGDVSAAEAEATVAGDAPPSDPETHGFESLRSEGEGAAPPDAVGDTTAPPPESEAIAPTEPPPGDVPEPPPPPPPANGGGAGSAGELLPPPPDGADASMEEAPLDKAASRPTGAGERDHIEEPDPPPAPDDLDDILPARTDLPPPEPD